MPDTFSTRFAEWILKYRILIIILTLPVIFLLGSGGKYLKFETNYRVFFSDDNPQLLAFEKLEATYTKNDNVLFVLVPKNNNVFTRKNLDAVEKLTKLSWQIPYSIRVDSISNFQHTYAEGDDLVVHDLVENALQLSDEDLKRIKTIALNEPLLINKSISPDSHATGVNITIQLPGKDVSKEVPEVVKYARKIAADFRESYPDIEIRIAGMVLMNNAFSESSQADMKSLVLISFALMMFVLALLLRSFTGTLVTMFVIIFSIIAGMGAGGYIGFPMTPPSASAPTIITTMAIANSVHILISFVHAMQNGMPKRTAMIESLRINLQPVFLASFTTVLGFLSMNFSEVPPFRHLGNFVSMGVAATFFLSVTFLPALISFLPVRVGVKKDGDDHAMMRFAEFVVKRRSFLIKGMAIITITLIAFIPRNELNDIFLHYFDKTTSFRQDSDFTIKHLTGLYQIEYSIVSGKPGGISDPAFLNDVDNFANWYRQQPEVIHVNTLTDIMKRLNRNMHGDDPGWYKLPEKHDLSAQYLLLYEMSLPYGLDLNNQINLDKSATRMSITIKTISSNDVIGLAKRADQWLKANAPHIVSADSSGTTIMFANIGKRNIISMLIGTTIALILISFVLIIALRSFKIGLVSMLPNLVPAAMGFGLWGMLVGEVGLALSIVAGMTLGIVVDDTVHFLSKYLRARREKGLNSPDAVRYAFNTVGRALIVTSVVLIVGFMVLSLSTFKLNSAMGLLTAIVIAFALMADFLLLPTLLMKIDKDEVTNRGIIK